MRTLIELNTTAETLENMPDPVARCLAGLDFLCEVLGRVSISSAADSFGTATAAYIKQNYELVQSGIRQFFVEHRDIVFPLDMIAELDRIIAKFEEALRRFYYEAHRIIAAHAEFERLPRMVN